jgi:hypothetical protein
VLPRAAVTVLADHRRRSEKRCDNDEFGTDLGREI